MSIMAFQITGVSMVCSTVCSGADQRKHQSSASLAFVRRILRWPVMRKMFPFDDVMQGENLTRKLLSLYLDLFFNILVLQFSLLIFCYPNPIIYPYILLVVLLLQYVALSISVQGTSYVLVIINWCRVAISKVNFMCALTCLCFFFLASVVTCGLCLIFVICTWLLGCANGSCLGDTKGQSFKCFSEHVKRYTN